MALADNLSVYWAFDEASSSLLDSHGSANGTETSGTIDSATGLVGNARDFEFGDSEWFVVSDSAAVSVADIDFMFAGWANPESKPGSGIFWKGDSSTCAYALDLTTANFRWRCCSGAAFANQTLITDNSNPANGSWHFVVVWHDSVNNQIGIKVNNVQNVSPVSYSAGSFDDANTLLIGANPFSEHFDGLLDEWGFWKGRLLSNDEQTELYNGGAGRDYAYITGGAATGQPAGRRFTLGANGIYLPTYRPVEIGRVGTRIF